MDFNGVLIEVRSLEVRGDKSDKITDEQRRKFEHLLFSSEKNVNGTFESIICKSENQGLFSLSQEIKKKTNMSDEVAELLCFTIRKKEIVNAKFYNTSTYFTNSVKFNLNTTNF